MDRTVPALTHSTNLSAEVKPFVPKSDLSYVMTDHPTSHTFQHQLPHYLTSCYPFVQDHPGNIALSDHIDYQNYYKEVREYSQVPLSSNSSYRTGKPSRLLDSQLLNSTSYAPTSAQSSYVYSSFPNSAHLQHPNFQQISYHLPFRQTQSPNQFSAMSSYSIRESSLGQANERKQHASPKGQRSIGVQIETILSDPNDSTLQDQKMVDCALQTDFPSEIASKNLSEKPSPLKHKAGTSYPEHADKHVGRNSSYEFSDNNGDEADVDSDSGYYSPKHQLLKTASARTPEDVITSQFEHSQITDPPHQRLFYLSGRPHPIPQAFYHVHPRFFNGSCSPGQVIRLPAPVPPSMIMTPPPIFNSGTNSSRHLMAMTNFKSRSPWEQEILKAHNVAPVCRPTTFFPQNPELFSETSNHYNVCEQRDQHYHQRQGPRYSGVNKKCVDRPLPGTNRRSHGTFEIAPGALNDRVTHSNPPKLTEEEFPDLHTSAEYPKIPASALSNVSYSAALQSKPKVHDSNTSDGCPIENLIDGGDSVHGKIARRRRKKTERAEKAAAEEYAEITMEQENLKKQLNKKTIAKSKTSQLDLAEMLNNLEKSQTQAEHDDYLQKKSQHYNKGASGKTHQRPAQYMIPHNPLDSSAPMKMRGKERETPKAKKPSALKKVILKEREEKKTARTISLTTEDVPKYDIPPVPENFLKKAHCQKEELSSKELSVTKWNESQYLTTSEFLNSNANIDSNLPKIHSRRYREYCSGQVLDKQIDEECILMLQKLVQFQERMYLKDPIKAKHKRRLVLGLREVTKHLKLNKLCCVLISPNLEKIQSKGGLDDALQQIIDLCKNQSVPHVFALGRCAMGRAVSKLVPVSIIGIFDYSGAEENFKKILELAKDAQEKYHEMMILYQKEITEAMTAPPVVTSAPTKRFAYMTHSRNASAASCISFCSMISEPISEMPPDGTSWRKMMEVGLDEHNSNSVLSPPLEVIAGERLGDDVNSTLVATNLKDMLTNSIDDFESNDKQNADEMKLDSSYSSVGTVVLQRESNANSTIKSMSDIVEGSLPTSTETQDRITSWLASSVQTISISDHKPDGDSDNIEKDYEHDLVASTHGEKLDDFHE